MCVCVCVCVLMLFVLLLGILIVMVPSGRSCMLESSGKKGRLSRNSCCFKELRRVEHLTQIRHTVTVTYTYTHTHTHIHTNFILHSLLPISSHTLFTEAHLPPILLSHTALILTMSTHVVCLPSGTRRVKSGRPTSAWLRNTIQTRTQRAG